MNVPFVEHWRFHSTFENKLQCLETQNIYNRFVFVKTIFAQLTVSAEQMNVSCDPKTVENRQSGRHLSTGVVSSAQSMKTHALLVKLASVNIRAIGTVQHDRTGEATESMISNKEFIKKDRGSFDYRSDGKVDVVKWHDNSAVTAASNWLTHEPITKVKHHIKKQQKEVKQPQLLQAYNTGMGGVDFSLEITDCKSLSGRRGSKAGTIQPKIELSGSKRVDRSD
ncbi:PiggyBac transposable element-derived protein 3 [Trichinella zimbabwensis]|uniref:PiggyBac transposable element-derived protein 3 n=1 Tax=Trichinella zimbabwensis TaxID=268475 RepID=A0A0V1GVU4_9BILA|nr:PiggyBac transposable element-derived protein 3 [Trichinella zimbabwensis]